MANLKDVLATDRSKIFLTEAISEEVVYTPNGGAARTIRAHVTMGKGEIVEDTRGEYLVRSATLRIAANETEGVEHPSKGDEVTLDEVRFVFEQIEEERRPIGMHVLKFSGRKLLKLKGPSLHRRT